MKISFNDNLSVAGKQLHLQTHLISDQGQVVNTLFDQGRVLSKKVKFVENGHPNEELKETVLRMHQAKAEQIRFISRIREEVISVRHAPSLVRLARLYLGWGLVNDAEQVLQHIDQAVGESIHLKLVQANILFRKQAWDQIIQLFPDLKAGAPDHAEITEILGKCYLQLGHFDHAYTMLMQLDQAMTAESHLLASLCLLREFEKTKDTSNVFGLDQALDRCAFHFKQAVQCEGMLQMKDLDFMIQEIRLQNYQSACDELKTLIRKLPAEPDRTFHDLFFLRYLFDPDCRGASCIGRYIRRIQESSRNHQMKTGDDGYLGMAYIMLSLEYCHMGITQFQKPADAEASSGNLGFCINACQEAQIKMADFLKICLKNID